MQNHHTIEKLETLLVGIPAEQAAHIRALFLTDQLTQLANKQGFLHALGESLDLTNMFPSLLGIGVVMLDGDSFGAYNKLYGEVQGDTLIETVGRTIHDFQRDTDVVTHFGEEERSALSKKFGGRFGGDEFATFYLFPLGNGQGRLSFAQIEHGIFPSILHRLSGAISRTPISRTPTIVNAEEHYRPDMCMGYNRITATIGGHLYVSGNHEIIHEPLDLLGKANEALRLVKSNGRGSTHILP